jgi:predicted ATPase
MITKIRLENFKSFADTGEIDIKPITVLAGPNSGGKSTILQSLLLLKQTLETESTKIALDLDGRFLQCTSFNELVFNKPPLKSCKLGYELIVDTNMPSKEVPKYFPTDKVPKRKTTVYRSKLRFSFRYKEVEEEGKIVKRVILSRLRINTYYNKMEGPVLNINFRNKEYTLKIDGPQPLKKKAKVGLESFRHFLPNPFFFEKKKSEEPGEVKTIDNILFFPIHVLEREIKDGLNYLGPLRVEPQRAYLHTGSPFPELGRRGEYAAQMLWLEKDLVIDYKSTIEGEQKRMPLIDAVNDVFLKLGITTPIDIKSVKSIIYQIFISLLSKREKKQVTIADVGFGISQLLPVIIMGLRSSENSLLLLEQPEIHLHPKLQANLADFLLSVALTNKRILVETHSDHFINRLRRRIAEDKSDSLKEKINILFIRPATDQKGAVIDPLEIDRYGVIKNWPPDFLPESADEAEAIFRAGLEKRKA